MDKYKNKYRIQSHRKPNWDYSADAFYFLTIVTQNRECNLGTVQNNEMILSDFGKIVEQEWFQSFEIRKELILHQFILMPNHLHAIVEIHNENRDVTTIDGDDITVGNGGDGTSVETHGRVSLPSQSTIPTHPSQSTIPTHPSQSTIPIKTTNPIELFESTTPIKSTESIKSIKSTESIKSTNPIELFESINPTIPITLEISSIKRNPPIRLPKSISSFIAGFKSSVNTKIDDIIDEHQLGIQKYNRHNPFFQPNYHDHIVRNDMEYHSISNYIKNNPFNWNKDKFNG